MTRTLGPGARLGVLLAGIAFVIGAILLTQAIPAVEGLGEKVRLPIFHGGSTWVNLMTFGLMGAFGLAYLLVGREDLYRWAAGFRGVSAVLWVVNTVLGVIAATQTWDFSGSSQAPISVMREDPRLMAQFQLLALLAVVLIVDSMVDSRKVRAFLDAAYAVAGGVWLWMVLSSPKAQALHPDNPVLNSGSDIQTPFFAIVGSVFVAMCLFAWLVRDRIARND